MVEAVGVQEEWVLTEPLVVLVETVLVVLGLATYFAQDQKSFEQVVAVEVITLHLQYQLVE
jgi:hypothetical protein